MGKRDLKELNSRVRVPLSHLLKWHLQPAKKSRSWERTIASRHVALAQLLEESPSLRVKIHPNLRHIYQKSVQLAVLKTGLPKSQFPAERPFAVEQILDAEFLP